jgi:hypothetical protein
MRLKPDYAKLADLCDKSGLSRYGATSGVRLCYSNGELQADATDGRKLFRLRVPCSQPEYFPADVPIVIPPVDWVRLCKLGQPWTTKGCAVELTLDPDRTLVAAAPGRTLTIPARGLIEGRFPDTDKVIPKSPPLFTVHVKAGLLAELLAAIASHVGPEDDGFVSVSFFGDKEPVLIVGNLEDGKAEALITQVERTG